MANKEYKKYWGLLKTVINRKIGECIKHRGCQGDWHVIEQSYRDIQKAIEQIERGENCHQSNNTVENMVSPFTGGKVSLETKEIEIEYRGELLTIERQYYRCVDTNKTFTDEKLDNDMMWAAFRAYWDKRDVEHFSDIDYYGCPKIKGYIARDKIKCNTDLGLFIEEKPNRGTRSWVIDHPTHKYDPCELPLNLFPELKWEDEPQEVEIIIKKK